MSSTHMDEWRELKLMTKALADVARLTLIYHLARQQETTVTTLTDLLRLSQQSMRALGLPTWLAHKKCTVASSEKVLDTTKVGTRAT